MGLKISANQSLGKSAGVYAGVSLSGQSNITPQVKCCPSPYESCCKYWKSNEVVYECKVPKDCWKLPGGVLVSDSKCCKEEV